MLSSAIPPFFLMIYMLNKPRYLLSCHCGLSAILPKKDSRQAGMTKGAGMTSSSLDRTLFLHESIIHTAIYFDFFTDSKILLFGKEGRGEIFVSHNGHIFIHKSPYVPLFQRGSKSYFCATCQQKVFFFYLS